jgi:hypothetical protein
MGDTLFKEVNYTLGSLMNHIELRKIGFRDILRPVFLLNVKKRSR